ncbi:uncharacterized protein LOC116295680 isoform X2 [Actinia tenebrosa]|uniref:Uncharacterized protein LOC116295680 isoform X2 n=1 Tax=Actinia tenebrosa TaxID=6105 RepID=A0A6P8HVP0_ACTTE|nr:uncharacterized protein LOC116295680 isoform X2 [Actinia tenebrosa]
MGNIGSQPSTLSDEERNRLDENLERMERNVRITSKSHFVSSEYYQKRAQRLDFLTTIVLPTSVAGLTAIVLPTSAAVLTATVLPTSVAGLAVSFNTSKRIGVAFSVIGLVLGGFQKLDKSSDYHPSKMQAKHFDAGIGLQSFHSEVMLFRQLRLKEKSLTVKELRKEYRELIKKKERFDKVIPTDTWAYKCVKAQILENQKENDKEN